MASLETLASAEIQEAQMLIARLVVAQWKKAELDRLKFVPLLSNSSRNGSAKGKSIQDPSPSAAAPVNTQPAAPDGEVTQQTLHTPAQRFAPEAEPPEEQPRAAEEGQAVA